MDNEVAKQQTKISDKYHTTLLLQSLLLSLGEEKLWEL